MTTAQAPATRSTIDVDGIRVLLEGQGEQTILMIHGWPDSHRLWDAQVRALAGRFRCARFTLPGFDLALPSRPTSMQQMTALIAAIVDAVSPQRPVILMLHDWGCIFGYQYWALNPARVARVIGVDIGDVATPAYLNSLDLKAKLGTAAYQLWLALAWKLGGTLGDRMSRRTAAMAGAPGEAATIGAQMNYPYAMRWFGLFGGMRDLRPPAPSAQCPMLFLYGRRKPFMFHSPSFEPQLVAIPGCAMHGLQTSHWVMTGRPEEFNRIVLDWLT